MENGQKKSCLQSFAVKLRDEGISIQHAPARESNNTRQINTKKYMLAGKIE